jgi:hypothetical protein
MWQEWNCEGPTVNDSFSAPCGGKLAVPYDRAMHYGRFQPLYSCRMLLKFTAFKTPLRSSMPCWYLYTSSPASKTHLSGIAGIRLETELQIGWRFSELRLLGHPVAIALCQPSVHPGCSRRIGQGKSSVSAASCRVLRTVLADPVEFRVATRDHLHNERVDVKEIWHNHRKMRRVTKMPVLRPRA